MSVGASETALSPGPKTPPSGAQLAPAPRKVWQVSQTNTPTPIAPPVPAPAPSPPAAPQRDPRKSNPPPPGPKAMQSAMPAPAANGAAPVLVPAPTQVRRPAPTRKAPPRLGSRLSSRDAGLPTGWRQRNTFVRRPGGCGGNPLVGNTDRGKWSRHFAGRDQAALRAKGLLPPRSAWVDRLPRRCRTGGSAGWSASLRPACSPSY